MTSRDSGDRKPARGRQKHLPVPVTHDTPPAPGDRNLSPGDSDEQPSHQANESRYGAAPTASPPSQRAGLAPGSNHPLHLTVTRPDLVAITPEQREQLVAVLTSMILDFLQRQRTEHPRPD